MMKQVERIAYFEEVSDKLKSLLYDLNFALDELEGMEKDLIALDRYYDSDEWRTDFEDDEAGKLPKDLKRGVLSEDGLYNLLDEYDELILRLQMIKNVLME